MNEASPCTPTRRKRRASGAADASRHSKRINGSPTPPVPTTPPTTSILPPPGGLFPNPLSPPLSFPPPIPSTFPPAPSLRSNALPRNAPRPTKAKKSKSSKAYDDRRRERFLQKKSAETPHTTLSRTLASFSKHGEYRGKAYAGTEAQPTLNLDAGCEW